MQQVVVDMVHLQALERLVVHLCGLFKVPQIVPLVRHLRGHKVLVARVAAQGVAGKHLRAPAHIHRCRIEVVHPVSDGIVHQPVHFLLIVRQSHHAKAQQRDLFAGAVLHAIGHAVLYGFLLIFLRQCP